ncbi:hypothetical protein MKX03_028027 [Papaver bracteatum]|nr:hypothetical protein MKX03_028027 [Papaver bracteatum]
MVNNLSMAINHRNSTFFFSVLVLFFLLLGSTFSGTDQQVVVQNHGSEGLSLSKLFLFGDSYLDTGNNNFTVRSSFMGIESPMPNTQWKNLSKRSTGVFDTWMKEGNMTTQINAFKQYIADGVYNKRDLKESIAVVSNAGNDYTQYYEVDHGTHEGDRAFVAKVIDQLELNLREIRKTGVKKVVTLTMQPLGCLPNKARTLSYKKCDRPLNTDTIFHNKLLQKAVQRLNREGTSAEFGNPLLKPCCTPAALNALCGSVDANGVKLYTLCANPNDYLFWDLYHPTQSGWHSISSALKPSFDELMQCNIFSQSPSASAFFGSGVKY